MQTTRLLAVVIAFALPPALQATPGDLDPLDANLIGTLVTATAAQPDGKTIIGGAFTSVLGVPRSNIARVNADGTLDIGFDPKASGNVYGLAVQADGKVLLGGFFTTLQLNGAPTAIARNGFARLQNDAATQTLSVPDGTRVQWQRGGAAPDLARTIFDLSTNGGSSWSPLGPGTRVGVKPNWQVTDLALPASGQIRARGLTTGGTWGGSSGLIEQVTAFSFLTPLQSWKLTHLGNANAPTSATRITMAC